MDKKNLKIENFIYRIGVVNALKNAGIYTLSDLICYREDFIKSILYSDRDFVHLKENVSARNEQMRGAKVNVNETPIKNGMFSDRIYYAIKVNGGVYSIEDIIQVGEIGLTCLHNIGKEEIEEIKSKLVQMGYKQNIKKSNDTLKQFEITKLGEKEMDKDLNEIAINELELGRVAYIGLKRAGIETIGKLAKFREPMLERILIHSKDTYYIKEFLKNYNIKLRGDEVLENETPITKEMFSTGVYNALTQYGHNVITVEDVLLAGKNGLLRIHGFGESRLKELEKGLEKMGLAFEPEVKIEEKIVETKDKKLYKQISRCGIIETLEKLPCKVFEKGSPEMEEIIECVTLRLNEISAKQIKDAETDEDYGIAEAQIDTLMNDYMILVQRKRDEYEKMQKDALFGEKIATKIDKLKKFHHKPIKIKEGHDHNPYVDEESEL